MRNLIFGGKYRRQTDERFGGCDVRQTKDTVDPDVRQTKDTVDADVRQARGCSRAFCSFLAGNHLRHQ